MARYLLKQRDGWYAVLEIPKALRGKLGMRRFKRTLKTDSLSEAKLRVLPIVAGWKAELEEAKTGKKLGIEGHMLAYRDEYLKASPYKRLDLKDILSDELDYIHEHDPDRANEIYGIITGEIAPLGDYIEEWLGVIQDTPKTKDMKRSEVREFSKKFKFSNQVTKRVVKTWAHELQHPKEEGSKGLSKKTVQRKLSFLSGYWKYLQSAGYIDREDEPFKGAIEFTKREKAKTDSYVPLANEEVVAALDTVQGKGDHKLGALIWLAMWTGCRIEELCSLKVEDVFEDRLRIVDAKTKAGIREVPVHSSLSPSLKELKETSYDGYILSGLSFNKYGDRSNAIGKRFGRLKLGPNKVFHSIRKTVVTQLHNAGLPVETIAEIVGHEHGSFTLSVYSEGLSLYNKRIAVDTLSYPLNKIYLYNNIKSV